MLRNTVYRLNMWDKEVQYRIVYGYRIEIYDMKMNLITTHEVNISSNSVAKVDEHYQPIANKVPKSLPEIKRQFSSTFKNGEAYLNLAYKTLGQAGYHARQILKLKELYSIESLDKILAYCVQSGLCSIDQIKEVLREKYIEIVLAKKMNTDSLITGKNGLIRDLSYYEGGGQN